MQTKLFNGDKKEKRNNDLDIEEKLLKFINDNFNSFYEEFDEKRKKMYGELFLKGINTYNRMNSGEDIEINISDNQ